MKSTCLLLVFCIFTSVARATTFMITVSDNQFSPASIPNVIVGDVIQFNFAPFNSHNATSTPLGSVPAGAANIFSGNPGDVTTSYSYTVTHAGTYFYYCEVHSFDGVSGMAGTFTATGATPVSIKSFEVRSSGNNIIAQWETSSEQNVTSFSLMKSTDGRNYTEAGRVPAAGNSNTVRHYSLKDGAPTPGTTYVYYKLKTNEADGRSSFSSVKLFRNTHALPVLITEIGPNPVRRSIGHLIFRYNSDGNGVLNTVVQDQAGKVVMRLDLSAVRGINNGHIHMSDLPAGIYTVQFRLGNLKEARKVVLE